MVYKEWVKYLNRSHAKNKSQVEIVQPHDISIIYDLLYVYDRLYWKSAVGNKQAQKRIDELHEGKYGDNQGFYVQCLNAIKRLEKVFITNKDKSFKDWTDLERLGRNFYVPFHTKNPCWSNLKEKT